MPFPNPYDGPLSAWEWLLVWMLICVPVIVGLLAVLTFLI